jgi:hypothetical protein
VHVPRQTPLHLFALSGFAVAQPLYDLIGRHAEFLVAHRAGRWTVLAIVGVLSVGIPLALIVLAWTARLAGARVHSAAVSALAAILAGLTAAGGARQLAPLTAISIAAAVAIATALLYRLPSFRTFLTVLSPAGLLFPILFLTATPVTRLVWAPETAAATTEPQQRPPIVLVVFDELDTLSLLDGGGEIDAERFPKFAGLARTSTWFPNALAAFPYTTDAVPAILTGVRPEGPSTRLPIVADHPNNLFTWLAGHYRLHAFEPFTALCPPARCGEPAAPTSVHARALASDIGILYLHLIVPREIAESRLPQLAFAWKGFAAPPPLPASPPIADAPAAPHDPEQALGHVIDQGRHEVFRRFIGEIRGGDEPVLHFIHMPLPHDPYEYLRSGLRYAHGGMPAGLKPNVWTEDPVLVDTGRRRHVEQLRFTDAMLGELLAKLRTEGLFDRALIIVTSDHGGAFVPGEPHRVLTAANHRELLATPIFVKLPDQKTGGASDRHVTGLDVVPSIASALGARVPWHVDGHPVLADDFPARPTIAYGGLPLPAFETFDVREESRRRARAGAAAGDAEGQLVGRPLSQLELASSVAGRMTLSDAFRAFEAVSLASGQVPALVTGTIAYETAPAGPVQLAVAVNGVVQAVTRTAHWNNINHFFSAFVPDAAFRDGTNLLQVLAIERTERAYRLSPIPSPLPNGLRIERARGGERLVASSGPIATLQPHIVGSIDRVDESVQGMLLLHGWAADTRTARQLRAVVAFSGGSAVGIGFPGGDRPDVVAALGLANPVKTGFALTISKKDVHPDGVRVFGLTFEDAAGELTMGPQPKEFFLTFGVRETTAAEKAAEQSGHDQGEQQPCDAGNREVEHHHYLVGSPFWPARQVQGT